MRRSMVGRHEQLRRLTCGLAALQESAAVRTSASGWTVLGPPGMGKSTLVGQLLQFARRDRTLVISVAPTAIERDLAWSGLALAMGSVHDHVVPEALAPFARRDLLSAPDAATAVSEFVGWIRGLGRPVLLLLDDAQWIDGNSAAVLTSVIRSIANVMVVEVVREGEESAIDLRRLLGDDHSTLRLEGLTVADTGDLVNSVADQRWDPGEVAALHSWTSGHPMHVLEIARETGPTTHFGPGSTNSVSDVLTARVAGLSAPCFDVLAAVSLMTRVRLGQLAALFDQLDVAAELEPAERAGLVRVRGDAVEFAHGLAQQSVGDSVGELQRRLLHRRIAEVVDSDDERLRHLADAVVGHDEALAGELEAAAARAVERGATIDALALIGRGLRITPPDDVDTHRRRLIAGGMIAADVGNWHQASDWMHQALDGCDDLDLLAANALQVACTDARTYGWSYAESIVDEFVRRLESRPEAQCHLLDALSRLQSFRDLAIAERTAHRAVELARQRQLANASIASRIALGGLQVLRGGTVDIDALIALSADWDGDFSASFASDVVGEFLIAHGRFGEADVQSRVVLEFGRRVGDNAALIAGLAQRASATFWLGEWVECEELNAAVADLCGGWANPSEALNLVGWLQLAAALGRNEVVDQLSPRLDLTIEADPTFAGAIAGAALGFTLLARGDVERAATTLWRACADSEAVGYAKVSTSLHIDAVEALTTVGAIDRAESINASARSYPATSSIPVQRAGMLFAEGLVAQATRNHARAVEALEQATAIYEGIGARFVEARARLAYADALRLSRQRTAARRECDAAARVFAKLGAQPWERRAHSLLERVSQSGTASELTPSERQVIEGVLAGRTNQEMANQMYVSLRTIESHLTHIYRKYGVKSRTALAAVARSEPEISPTR